MSTLHITNGNCAAGTMREFLRDPVVITADPLFEGPPPPDSANWDPLIAKADQFDEVVLWFEHDLFDQLLLIRTLHFLGGPERPALRTPRVSLICIDRFPGVERFYGLGQLIAQQLASLVDTRRPVTNEQFGLATKAWNAFRDPDPSGLVEMVRGGTDALPFLGHALKRFLQEYPSTTNGLTRTGNAVLNALEAGPLDGGDLFRATQAAEEHPFMGDWSLYAVVHQLARAPVPLVAIDPDDRARDLRGHVIAIADAGRDVLAGRQDAVALNGVDLWRGGVHVLTSSASSGADRSIWRWDARRETLV